MRGSTVHWTRLSAGVSALFALGAFFTAITWEAIFDSVLAGQLALAPNTRSYYSWLAPTVPINFDVYMFNWTNPDKFPEEKPNFVQLGPYRYQEKRRHVDITWHPHNSTVGYKTQRSWIFDEAGSNGSLDDTISTLNMIAASAVYKYRFSSFVDQKAMSIGLALYRQHIYITKTVRQLLFEGYEDPILDAAKSMPSSMTGGAPLVDRFGWFYNRNNTDTDGYIEVTTGSAKGTIPGQIQRWNHEQRMSYYKGECAKIAGSAGEFLPRNLTEESTLRMFVPDLCRTIDMEYVTSGVMDGLNYHKYEVSERSFDNSSTSPGNTCFCNGPCAWSGVMNVSACRFGSPAFITLPHFLHGDQSLRDMVTGMEPDPEKHSFYFAVEPKMGVPIDVAGRFQFNVYIEPSPYVALYENVPRMLFPMFWVEQKAKIDEAIISELRIVRKILDWGGILCACSAVGFAAVSLTILMFCKVKPKYSKPKDLLKFDKMKDEAELKLNPI
ncbi:hypothetical protein K1T71_009016 [Dendrolimus kikuchii]|uniref:Uncharacterized protein n=1 Tax=Dendrolimus kikuchii TaxID=765133 RepID=A0ACC1CX55_9NEOP|nr:hypothetical protein K1T71_009016 [Dendrolimus kikuchii]